MYDFYVGPDFEGGYSHAFSVSRQKLRKLSIADIIRNSRCEFDIKSNCFSLKSFNTRFEISYPGGDVQFSGQEGKRPFILWRLLLLNYLSAAKDLPAVKRCISYKDQPNGGVFYPNILTKVITPMGEFYDQCDKTVLQRALSNLGFIEKTGNATMTRQGYFAPRVPVKVQFWAGDDEIPGAFQILFDAGISEQMHIEDSAGLCELIKLVIVDQYERSL